MPTQDTLNLKEKILSIIRIKGPSFPARIAREVNTSILFTSAFLSELLSEKKLKISFMRVGSSPVYFIQGQEAKLENFAEHLRSKEKEAYVLLKEKKFLADKNQEPAIRVALRAIKDFAIPFKSNNEIVWKYQTASLNEFVSEKSFSETKKPETVSQTKTASQPSQSEIKQIAVPQQNETSQTIAATQNKSNELNIFDSSEKKIKTEVLTKPKFAKKSSVKSSVRKTSNSQGEKFFEKVKEYLQSKNIVITDIVGFNKTDLTLKIKSQGEEKLLVAYNKKRIGEAEIVKAYKKAAEVDMPYMILSLGEMPKKLGNLISAVQSLAGIEKII